MRHQVNITRGIWEAIYNHESNITTLKKQIDAINEAVGGLGPDAIMLLTNSLMAQITAFRDAIDALKIEMKKYEDPNLPLNKILERVTQRSDFDYATTCLDDKPVTECLTDWVPRHGGPVAVECITHSALETIAFQAVRKQLPSDARLENMHAAAKWMAEHGNDTLLKFLESEDFRAFVAEKQVMERLS